MSPSSTEQTLLVRLMQQGFQIKSSRQRNLGAHPVCISSKMERKKYCGSTHCGFLQVYEFSLTGGQTVLVWLRPGSSDPDWNRQVFESEIGLIRWLSACSSVHAPRLLHVLQSDVGNPWSAFATQGMTGEPIRDIYSRLSSWAKV